MADQRLGTSIVGKEAVYLGFDIDNSQVTWSSTADGGSSQVGLAVTYDGTNDGQIKLTEDGEAVLGRLHKVEQIVPSSTWRAVVQVGGGMELPGGASASLTLGKKIVGALGASNAKGYIREVATATAAELGVARGMIHDASDTTAVQVWL